MSKYLLDSSALIEFFEGSKIGAAVCNILEGKQSSTSLLAVAEISDVFARKKKSCEQELAFLERNMSIHQLSLKICRESGRFKASHRNGSLSLTDALIYLTAQENNLILVTKDQDFKGMKNVLLLT